MLKIGIIGFGFMGRMHYRCWSARQDAQVAAICDVNPNIVEDSKKAAGNIAGATEAIDFSKLKVFTDPAKMYAECDLDAVSITVPTFLHPDAFIRAVRAGVHVLCEKPMGLTTSDCDRMIAAAEGSGLELLIGQCERFSGTYQKIKSIIDSGEYGPVRVASFRRVGSIPTWAWENWFLNVQQSGGVELDLHIHDTDLVQYLFGMPKAVTTYPYELPGGGIGHLMTRYRFDDKLVTAEGGWLMTGSFGFEMSSMFVLEKATIHFDSGRKPALRICPCEGEIIAPEQGEYDGYERQIDYFCRRIHGEKIAPVATLQQARASVMVVEKERQSATSGCEAAVGG